MKWIFLFIELTGLLLRSEGQTTKRIRVDKQSTRYKPGFTYSDNRGVRHTLLKWTNAGGSYRWRVKSQFAGQSYLTWTDDGWIDVALHHAFVNERTHQIVYYDSVNIVPKRK